MRNLLKGTMRAVLMAIACVMLSAAGYAQVRVSGVVTDENTSEPLPGVAVMERGTSNAVLTDIEGRYNLRVKDGASIEFQFLGYKNYVIDNVKGGTYNVAMETESEVLDDVIVLGTRMAKSDLTGAIGSLSEKQLKEIPSSSFTQSMQGKVAGVFVNSSARPGDAPTIKVRGTNSINYGQDPIYVIDGIVVDEGLNNINPDDIASIEVLKDASSKAIYGYRAANGVILVTTKKGRKGEGKITYDGWVGFQTYDEGGMKMMGSRDLFNLRYDAWLNQYMTANPNASDADIQNYINNTILASGGANTGFSEEELYNGQNDITSDWVSPITRTGIQHNHSLSFSGGTDKTTYYLGVSYTNQQGIIINSDYERFSGKINIEQEVKPWLKIGTNTTLSRAVTNTQEDNLYTRCVTANPMQTIDDRDYMYWRGGHDSSGNPLKLMDVRREQIHDRVLSSNYINVNPIEGLNIRTTFSIDYLNKSDFTYRPMTSAEGPRNDKGQASQWRGRAFSWQWDNSVSYEKIFNKKHRIFAMATASLTKDMTDATSISVSGFPSDIMGWYNIAAAANKDKANYSSSFITQTAVSFVQRVNYTYDNRYLFTVSLRQDGSSRFARGNQWGVFPSFSAAWNISSEKFLNNVDWLSMLKLRLGWGLVGNQAIPEYAYLSIYNPSYSNGNITFVSDGRQGNPDISWEKQNQFNVGVDASILNDRLSFSADYFYTINSDLLMQMSLSQTTGFNNRIANVAKLENQGVELSFNAKLLQRGDWTWNFSGNISHDKNKVKELYDGLQVIWSGNSITSREGNLFVGEPVNTYHSFKARIAQQSDIDYLNKMNARDIPDGNGGFTNHFVGGKEVHPGDLLPEDRNGDGKITYEDDMYIIGRKDPKFYGGFSTDLSWKDITLSATFSYSYGARRYSSMYESTMNLGGWDYCSHIDALDRWTPTNTDTDVPRAFRGADVQRFNIGETDWVLLDASYLRLSALTLSWNLPTKWISPVCENLRVYATCNNLFTWTPYKGYDPETGEDYPSAKMYVIGVNATF